MVWRRRAALRCFGLNHQVGKARLLQLVTDQRDVMVTMRRACQKAGRIIWKDLCKCVRYIICEHVFLNAIPHTEQKPSAALEYPLGLTVTGLAVREEHDAELAKDDVERMIFERQGLCICCSPGDANIGGLSRRRVVQHGLVE